MKFVMHRFFIVLLVVLQGLSPLVHAHVQLQGSAQDGIHIHDIAQAEHQHDQRLSLINDEHSCTAIGIQSGIQQKKCCSDAGSVGAVFNDLKLEHCSNQDNKVIVTAPYFISIKHTCLLSTISPRAPPHS